MDKKVPSLEELIAGSVEISVKKSVEAAFQKASCDLKCPIPVEAQRELAHLFGMIKDLGGGDLAKGTELIRDNHKYITRIQQLGCRVSNKIIGTVIGSIIVAALGAIGLGIKSYLGR